jgi:hypothetical protein
MIGIINRGGGDPNDPGGERDYEVLVTMRPGTPPTTVARFKHFRNKGLAACLRAAADAVEKDKKARTNAALFKAALFVSDSTL